MTGKVKKFLIVVATALCAIGCGTAYEDYDPNGEDFEAFSKYSTSFLSAEAVEAVSVDRKWLKDTYVSDMGFPCRDYLLTIKLSDGKKFRFKASISPLISEAETIAEGDYVKYVLNDDGKVVRINTVLSSTDIF